MVYPPYVPINTPWGSMQLTSNQQQIISVFHYTQLFSTHRGDKNDSPLPMDLPKQWFHFLQDCLSVYVLSTLIVVLPIYFFNLVVIASLKTQSLHCFHISLATRMMGEFIPSLFCLCAFYFNCNSPNFPPRIHTEDCAPSFC